VAIVDRQITLTPKGRKQAESVVRKHRLGYAAPSVSEMVRRLADLSDFNANLAGSKAAFEALRPLLDSKQSALAQQLIQRFSDVQAALDKYKGTDPTGNGYVLYSALTPDDTRTMATSVDTLAEPLSKVAAAVIG
jgi:iron uptake system EfeUOB component EfeO/EfeM